jgi:hypothetical protein
MVVPVNKPYDGVKGAITYNMIIPNTQNNKDMLNNCDIQIYSYERKDAKTQEITKEYYALMHPGAKLDVSTYIDMSTNAGYDVKGEPTYIDNTYFGCTIKTTDMKWLATQYDAGRAVSDVFDLPYVKMDDSQTVNGKDSLPVADEIEETLLANDCFIINLG